MQSQTSTKPIRVGVFSTTGQADRAVHSLLAVGFTKDEITVICSDKYTEEHFRDFEHQDPAGAHTPAAVATGSAIGAVLGGLTAIAGFITTGGVGVLIGGAMVAWCTTVVGGLIGAMMTRGVERELANYYDQSVSAGKILVAADDSRENPARLAQAEQIFRDAGAEPVELPEG